MNIPQLAAILVWTTGYQYRGSVTGRRSNSVPFGTQKSYRSGVGIPLPTGSFKLDMFDQLPCREYLEGTDSRWTWDPCNCSLWAPSTWLCWLILRRLCLNLKQGNNYSSKRPKNIQTVEVDFLHFHDPSTTCYIFLLTLFNIAMNITPSR